MSSACADDAHEPGATFYEGEISLTQSSFHVWLRHDACNCGYEFPSLGECVVRDDVLPPCDCPFCLERVTAEADGVEVVLDLTRQQARLGVFVGKSHEFPPGTDVDISIESCLGVDSFTAVVPDSADAATVADPFTDGSGTVVDWTASRLWDEALVSVDQGPYCRMPDDGTARLPFVLGPFQGVTVFLRDLVETRRTETASIDLYTAPLGNWSPE